MTNTKMQSNDSKQKYVIWGPRHHYIATKHVNSASKGLHMWREQKIHIRSPKLKNPSRVSVSTNLAWLDCHEDAEQSHPHLGL